MKHHQVQWDQLQNAWANGRLPQAVLLVGPLHCGLEEFAKEWSQLLLCQEALPRSEPCLKCQNCLMVKREEHPDIEWIRPSKQGASIKIEQIRQLQHSVYLSPQRAAHRISILDEADRMNKASSNALLKILEEPPRHTVFILLAQQISTLLPTIVSRCRMIRFFSDDVFSNNLLLLGERYPKESLHALILKEAPFILDGLMSMIEHQESACSVAASWASFDFNTLLWFLYLVFAEVLRMKMTTKTIKGPGSQQLIRLTTVLNPVLIFSLLDLINTQIRKVTNHSNPNATFALEQLLFTLMDGVGD